MLGDLVGYGAEPNAVIERVLALDPLATIRGNHDKAACWIEDAADFNHIARAAAMWTHDALTPEHRMYLQRLPAGPLSIDDRSRSATARHSTRTTTSSASTTRRWRSTRPRDRCVSSGTRICRSCTSGRRS